MVRGRKTSNRGLKREARDTPGTTTKLRHTKVNKGWDQSLYRHVSGPDSNDIMQEKDKFVD